MLLGSPIFYGFDPANQLFTMFKVLGFPSRSQLSYLGNGYDQLVLPKGQMRATLRDKLPCLGEEGHELLRRLLDWCPNSRISAAQALQHPYLAKRTVHQCEERANVVQFLIHKASDLSGISQEISHLSDEDENHAGVTESDNSTCEKKHRPLALQAQRGTDGAMPSSTEKLVNACNIYTVLDVPLASGASPKPTSPSTSSSSASMCGSTSNDSTSNNSSQSRAARKPTAAATSKGTVVPDSPLQTAEPPNMAKNNRSMPESSSTTPARSGQHTSSSARVLSLGDVDKVDRANMVRVSGVGEDEGCEDQGAQGGVMKERNLGKIVHLNVERQEQDDPHQQHHQEQDREEVHTETLLSPAAALRNSGLIQLRVPNWEGILEEAGIGASMATTLSQHSSQS